MQVGKLDFGRYIEIRADIRRYIGICETCGDALVLVKAITI